MTTATAHAILALDLGKYKTLACNDDPADGESHVQAFPTSRAELASPLEELPRLHLSGFPGGGGVDDAKPRCASPAGAMLFAYSHHDARSSMKARMDLAPAKTKLYHRAPLDETMISLVSKEIMDLIQRMPDIKPVNLDYWPYGA
jgi:hypothetical protein